MNERKGTFIMSTRLTLHLLVPIHKEFRNREWTWKTRSQLLLPVNLFEQRQETSRWAPSQLNRVSQLSEGV